MGLGGSRRDWWCGRCFAYSDAAKPTRRRADAPTRWRPGRRAPAAGAAAADQPEKDLQDLRAARRPDCSNGYQLGRSQRRRRPYSDRRGDALTLQRGLPPGRAQPQPTTMPQAPPSVSGDGQEETDSFAMPLRVRSRGFFVLVRGLRACRDATASAQMTGRADARLPRRRRACRRRRCRRRCGRSASISISISRCRSTPSSSDETGRTVRLGQYFGEKPVVLAFVYYECPMLCTQVHQRDDRARVGTMSLDAGKDFELVMVSFDPRETPAQARDKKAEYLQRYERPGRRRRLALPDRRASASIKRLTRPPASATSGTSRPSSSRTRPASSSSRLTAGRRDISSASNTDRATSGWRWSRRRRARSARWSTQLLLYCYHYDPMTGRYGFWRSCARCALPARRPCCDWLGVIRWSVDGPRARSEPSASCADRQPFTTPDAQSLSPKP